MTSVFTNDRRDQQLQLGPQVGSFRPVSAAWIMAAAQPTPACTLIAPGSQLSMHAPHSIQAFLLTMRAMVSPASNTPCGQTVLQNPQLVQSFGKNCSVLALSFIFIGYFPIPNILNKINTMPTPAMDACRGMYLDISRLTLVQQVMGVVPVWFKVKNETMAVMIKTMGATRIRF